MPFQHRIRVLLADANPTFLEAAARFLALDENLFVAGLASTGASALQQAERLRPNLLLADIGLADMNGLEVTRQVKSWPDPPRVIVLALNGGAEYRQAARNAGADGFVAKVEFYAEVYGLIHAWYAEPAVPGRMPASSVSNGTDLSK